jgi:hypothetical protein
VGPIEGLYVLLPKRLLRVLLFSFGLVPLGAAAPAADEHVVIVLEAAYFPDFLIVKQGDVIRFVNQSGRSHRLYHADGNWATKPFATGEELLVTVEPETTGPFYGMSSVKITGQLDLETPAFTD